MAARQQVAAVDRKINCCCTKRSLDQYGLTVSNLWGTAFNSNVEIIQIKKLSRRYAVRLKENPNVLAIDTQIKKKTTRPMYLTVL